MATLDPTRDKPTHFLGRHMDPGTYANPLSEWVYPWMGPGETGRGDQVNLQNTPPLIEKYNFRKFENFQIPGPWR